MAKILKIDNNTVVIGMDDGSTIEIPKTDIPFEIMEMMTIDVYEHEDRYLCSLPSGGTDSPVAEKVVKGKTYVRKVPYVLLYFFLGGFGIHEFYAGNKKKGCAWLALTVIIYIITDLPGWSIWFHYGFQAVRYYIEQTSDRTDIYSMIGMIYLFAIRILAIISMFKKSNENGRILVSKW